MLCLKLLTINLTITQILALFANTNIYVISIMRCVIVRNIYNIRK